MSRDLYTVCSKCLPPARTKISDVDELKRWADLNHAVTESDVRDMATASIYALAFVLETDISSI